MKTAAGRAVANRHPPRPSLKNLREVLDLFGELSPSGLRDLEERKRREGLRPAEERPAGPRAEDGRR